MSATSKRALPDRALADVEDFVVKLALFDQRGKFGLWLAAVRPRYRCIWPSGVHHGGPPPRLHGGRTPSPNRTVSPRYAASNSKSCGAVMILLGSLKTQSAQRESKHAGVVLVQ